MFTTKNLIGTPQRGPRSYEFTPIGASRRTNQEPEDNINQNMTTRASLRRTNEPSNNIKNPLKVDQSFLESFETTSVLGSSNINTPLVPLREKRAPTVDVLKPQNNILSNGATIRDQQQENKRLETENYNLKIKLATFTRFFDLSPEDQRKLLTENVDLKQQLMEKVHEIDVLRAEMAKIHEDKENTLVSALPGPNYSFMIAERDDTIRKLKDVIDKNNNELQTLRAQVANANRNSLRSPSDDLYGKLEYIQNENQSLRRQLQTLQDQLIQSQNDDSPSRNLDNMRKRIQEVDNEAILWKERFENLSAKLRAEEADKYSKQDMEKAWHEVEQAQKAYQSIRSELEATQTELRLARSEYSTANNKSETILEEMNSLKSQIRRLEHETSSLQSSLSAKNNELKSLQLEREGDKQAIIRLQNRLETLNEDLQDKEKQEYSLKKQINSLINERDNKSNDTKAFHHQYESMKERERDLAARNKDLQLELEKVKDQVYLATSNYSTNDERLNDAYDEIKELKDKLDFFEGEYEQLEKVLRDTEQEGDTLKSQLNKTKFTVADLEDSNQYLKKKLEASESQINELEASIDRLKSQATPTAGTSAIDQLDKYSARRLEEEKIELLDEIDTLKYELSRVRFELNQERTLKSMESNREHETFEIRRLTSERNQLQNRLEEKSLQASELEAKCRRLTLDLSDKEKAIETLESHIRDSNRHKKLDMFVEDEERTQFLKEKASNESQIRLLRHQNENLQKELDSQIAYYKSKVDDLMQSFGKHTGNENLVSNSMVALLEEQVDEAQKTKHELSFKLAEANSRIDELQESSRQAEAKLNSNATQSKELQDLNAALESSEKLLKTENSQLKDKTKRLSEEVDRVTRHCEKLASKLRELKDRELEREETVDQRLAKSVEEISKYKQNNRSLQRKIDDLSERLNVTQLDTSRKTKNQFDLLQNELQFYRAKLYDMNLRANDLSLVNSFVSKAVNNSDKQIKDQLVKLNSVTGFPKRSAEPQKLTFAIVAKFVLASVRIKRRFEKSTQRQERLQELRSQIEKQRYFV